MSFSISRRDLFYAPAALAAANALPKAAAATTAGFPIGVATYSLRSFQRPEAIEILKKLNVKHISIKEFHLKYSDTPEQIVSGAKEFRDAGFVIDSGGNISLQKPAELKAMFEYAKHAGMATIVCAPTHETLPAVEKLVKEYNIKAAIHNHGPEDKHFPTPQSVLDAVKGMDPRMGLCMDIGHSTRAGADIVEWTQKAGNRLFDLHTKDLINEKGKWVQVAVGDGNLPIVALFKALKKMNYQAGIHLEYEINAKDPYPGMERSLSYMRGVMAAIYS